MKIMLSNTATALVATATGMLLQAAPTMAQDHPLDSLTASEYEKVVELLTADGKVSNTSRFPLISLVEPEKATVKSFQPGDPFSRMATALVKDGAATMKATVDLTDETVTTWEEAQGEGMILLEEFMGAMNLALSSPEMIAGLEARDLTPDDVFCLPLTAGSFGQEFEQGRRLMKVPCYVLPEGSNFYAKPIEGLMAVVDLNAEEVLNVIDTGVVPVPEDPWGYTAPEIEERYGYLRGGSSQPNATTVQSSALADQPFTMDGSTVTWDIWRFHYRFDKRPGLILSEIDVNDKGTWRSVLYQAHLSEVFVPYMDPDEGWYWRTYMDSGEYGFGIFMSPLTRGVDCPTTATYLDTTFHDDLGMPFAIPDTICIFERDTGNPSWRHFELFAQAPGSSVPAEGRPAKELIVRYASEVGNYDYLVDYVFQQDGTIRMAVGSTGLDAVKGVVSTSMDDATAEVDTMYGSLIAPNLVAPNHDHYFNFRLDFDIEGEANSFQKSRLVPQNTTEDIPRKSYWKVETETVPNELEARTKVNPMSPSAFYFVNPNEESALGHNPSYQLIPGGSYAYSQMLSEDAPLARNAYIENPLWVTPYDRDQIYAGGEYAVMSNGSDTLKAWTEEGRSIENEDIVAWYTVGFHHVPRMEDWPVMPTHWAEFQIRPFNFFAHNPAITVAPPTAVSVEDVTSGGTSGNEDSSGASSLSSNLSSLLGFALVVLGTILV